MGEYTSIVTVLGTIISSIIAARAVIKSKKIEKENGDIKKDVNALDVIFDFSVFNQIIEEVGNLFKDTKADRYLTLYATNGKDDFKFVSAIFEQHEQVGPTLSMGAVHRYRKLEVDDDYKKMLKTIEYIGPVYIDTNTMEDGDLKFIYQSEKVTHACILFLTRIPIDHGNDILIFCSIATHDTNSFTDKEKSRIKIAHSILKEATEQLNPNKIK